MKPSVGVVSVASSNECASRVGSAALVCVLTLTAIPIVRADTELIIVNGDGPGEGLNDNTPAGPEPGNPGTTVGELRMSAVRYAFDVWEGALESDVPIELEVRFEPLGCWSPIAATAEPKLDGRLRSSLFLPIALLNRLAGTDLRPGEPDGVITVNEEFDDIACETEFYYGLDGADLMDGQHDFASIILHEVAHALGVLEGVSKEDGRWGLGSPREFDAHVFDLSRGLYLTELAQPDRLAAIQSARQLVWDGPAVRAAAAQELTLGTPIVSTTPSLAGFSGLVSDAAFGTRIVDQSISAEVTRPTDCTLSSSALNRIVLLSAGCVVPSVAADAEQQGAVALLVASSSWMPPRPLDYDSPTTIGIPVLSITEADGTLLQQALDGGGIIVNISGNPDQLLGADEEGRPYLNAGSNSLSGIAHWDALPRPSLLMEAGSAPRHDLDLTVAWLVDIGWNVCGDGIVTPPETCDDGSANSDTSSSACPTDCAVTRCGDGNVEGIEECDEGEANGVEGGLCRLGCFTGRCGDGIVDPGEDCDRGWVSEDPVVWEVDGCRGDCTRARCGDGIDDIGEQCDAGDDNGLPGSRCSADCMRMQGDLGADAGPQAADASTAVLDGSFGHGGARGDKGDGGDSGPLPRSDCGCRVVGYPRGGHAGLGGLTVLLIAVCRLRRVRRGRVGGWVSQAVRSLRRRSSRALSRQTPPGERRPLPSPQRPPG